MDARTEAMRAVIEAAFEPSVDPTPEPAKPAKAAPAAQRPRKPSPVRKITTPTSKRGSGHRRTVTLHPKRIAARLVELGAVIHPAWINESAPMPRTRGECESRGIGRPGSPCPYVRCKHHLAINVNASSGSITLTAPHELVGDGVPDLDLDAMSHTCSLTAANEGPLTYDEIGVALSVTRAAIEITEKAAFAKLRAALPEFSAFEFAEAPRSIWDAVDPVGNLGEGVLCKPQRTAKELRAHLRQVMGRRAIAYKMAAHARAQRKDAA